MSKRVKGQKRAGEIGFLIYALTCPRCGAIRYIGKSTSGMARPKAHMAPSCLRDRNHRTFWLLSLKSEGLRYGITILEELPSSEGLDGAEIRWIAHGRSVGWPLTNGTDGGDGQCGVVFSDETRAKMSAALMGKPRPYIIDRNKSPENRAKVSAALKGRVFSPETIEKMRQAARRRKPPSEATRAKWSAYAAARRHTEDELARMRIAQRDVWAREKARRAPSMRINLIGRFIDG